MIACQWARALGVTMIGTVGTDAKAALAKENGCTHTIVYTRENFVERVKELTGGKGVPVVYDGIGKDTCTRRQAHLADDGSVAAPDDELHGGPDLGQLDVHVLEHARGDALALAEKAEEAAAAEVIDEIVEAVAEDEAATKKGAKG